MIGCSPVMSHIHVHVLHKLKIKAWVDKARWCSASWYQQSWIGVVWFCQIKTNPVTLNFVHLPSWYRTQVISKDGKTPSSTHLKINEERKSPFLISPVFSSHEPTFNLSSVSQTLFCFSAKRLHDSAAAWDCCLVPVTKTVNSAGPNKTERPCKLWHRRQMESCLVPSGLSSGGYQDNTKMPTASPQTLKQKFHNHDTWEYHNQLCISHSAFI